MSYDSELEKYIDEYADYKEKFGQLETERQNGAYALNARTPEQLEKERQIKQMLSLMPRMKQRMLAEELYQNQNRPNTKVAGKFEISTYDLDFVIAEGLQLMESGENPRTEYHDWVEAEQGIENALVADGASQSEVDARNMFIYFLDDRETEMKRVMSLYAASAINSKGYYQELARDRYNFMQFKMSELRRLRTKMKSTVDHENVSEREVQQEHNNRDIYKNAAEGMVVAGYTLHAMDRYMKDKVHGEEMENSIAGRLVEFRPVTHSREESEKRIEALQQFSERQIVMAARMGLSKEDLAKQALKTDNSNEVRDTVRRMVGFHRDRFVQLQRERERTA